MSIARVGSPASVASFSGGTTPAIDTTGANLLVAIVVAYNNGFATVLTDSKGNTWTLAASYQFTVGTVTIYAYYVASPTVGTGHTFSIASIAACYAALVVQPYSGANVSPFDQIKGSANDGSNHNQAGSITPSEPGSLMVSAMAVDATNGTDSISSPFSVIKLIAYSSGSNYGVSVADQIQTTATAENPAWTTTAAVFGPTLLLSLLAVPGPQTISPAGVASSFAAGDPTIAAGAVTISPAGVASSFAAGVPTVVPGPVFISPAGVASSFAAGVPAIVQTTPAPSAAGASAWYWSGPAARMLSDAGFLLLVLPALEGGGDTRGEGS